MKIFVKKLIVALLLTAPSMAVMADDTSVSMYQHQEKMHQTIKSMNSLLEKTLVNGTTVPNQGVMKEHREAMATGIEQLTEMVRAKRIANAECLERQTADEQTCYQLESHQDTQLIMVVALLEHLLVRQNILEQHVIDVKSTAAH
ncbi:hypothetical protein K0504_07775 [Neiella marina]|uniref:Uncharacterized protein n=1 Tax=Neiella holothuriorum TaxID=2870530 RepID=A0ABS7EF15_9GAMM|nr:hypothetical protein [Neiella holothuriorum]MBW8190932.1 hypothetical protein [Neiella holothuriorum]